MDAPAKNVTSRRYCASGKSTGLREKPECMPMQALAKIYKELADYPSLTMENSAAG